MRYLPNLCFLHVSCCLKILVSLPRHIYPSSSPYLSYSSFCCPWRSDKKEQTNRRYVRHMYMCEHVCTYMYVSMVWYFSVIAQPNHLWYRRSPIHPSMYRLGRASTPAIHTSTLLPITHTIQKQNNLVHTIPPIHPSIPSLAPIPCPCKLNIGRHLF